VCRFPKYRSLNNRFSIWGESYGGHWGTNTADYFVQQNDKIAAGYLKNTSAIPLHLDTVGFINACIDIDTQMIFFPEFAHNNTYGIQAINDTQYASAIAASPTCKNMTAACRTLAVAKDPNGIGNQRHVNTACSNAFKYCFDKMHSAYVKSGVRISFLTFIILHG
jgi:carboxypeptidase C (cathepsin A)